MSQPSFAASSSPHPVLQAALSSLDVQLEVELAQYRCHQTVRRSPPPLAYQASQDQIGNTSNGTPLAKAELTALMQSIKQTDLNLTNSVSYSETPTITPSNLEAATPEPADSLLTLEAYLEFSRSCWKNLQESRVSKRSKFLQRLCSPTAIAAAVSLLLSIPLSYMIILHLASLIGVGSEACQATGVRSFYFCNGLSTLGDR